MGMSWMCDDMSYSKARRAYQCLEAKDSLGYIEKERSQVVTRSRANKSSLQLWHMFPAQMQSQRMQPLSTVVLNLTVT